VGTPSAGKTGHRGDHRLYCAFFTKTESISERLCSISRADRGGTASWPECYETVKRFVRKLRGPQRLQPAGIILTAPGEEAQVDYGSGPTVRDPQSGKYRRTRLFVLTLGYSRKSVRLLTWRSSVRTWPNCLSKRYVGGTRYKIRYIDEIMVLV